MQRFTSMILLSVYAIVSLLGHAGFDVLGLHSHGRSDATCEHSTLKCNHCNHSHKTVEYSEDDSHTSSEHPSDCVICKCFALLKMQVVASSLSTVTSVPFICESFAAYERLVQFGIQALIAYMRHLSLGAISLYHKPGFSRVSEGSAFVRDAALISV